MPRSSNPASRSPIPANSACNTTPAIRSPTKGYVKLPNVNSLVEIMDMREAQRSYEADLSVIDASKTMLSRTVDLLKK
jgi:flagellar basal body rod protein FlgC